MLVALHTMPGRNPHTHPQASISQVISHPSSCPHDLLLENWADMEAAWDSEELNLIFCLFLTETDLELIKVQLFQHLSRLREYGHLRRLPSQGPCCHVYLHLGGCRRKLLCSGCSSHHHTLTAREHTGKFAGNYPGEQWLM